MTTVSYLCINTSASELAMHFKLCDWINLINWTHLLQSETHVQYFDSFVCSGIIKVKINSLINCSTITVFFSIITPLSFQVRRQFNLHFI